MIKPLYSIISAACLWLGTAASGQDLAAQMDRAWEVTWNRFYLPKVQTFGDYLSSYEKGKEQAHLPTAEEVKRQYPNPCGYSTGMEDGAILGGAMLSLLCDRFAVTQDESLRSKAAGVFEGLRRCATVHGVRGFVARNVCPEDAQSVYINSSRDQVTHFVHGLWQYYHSPLPDEATKQQIRSVLADVAERMIAFVTPENDFDFCRADGTRCPLGICRMWKVQAHEAARLPMIYAAAWDVTHDERYRVQWRKYAAEAIEQSADPGEQKPAYALLQMQISLEVLHALEPDPTLKATIHTRMVNVRDLATNLFASVLGSIAKKSPEEMRMLGPDWRHVPEWKNQKGYPNPQWGPYREIWHLSREAGESALILLMVEPETVTEAQRAALKKMFLSFDYEHNSSCGIIYHLAAYWKARRHQLLSATVAAPAAAATGYQVVPNWPVLPAGLALGLCAGVGVDSHDNVFVFHRNGRVWKTPFPDQPIEKPTVSVIDGRSGKLLASWGANEFIMPHGLTLDREDNVWLTDVGRHQVFKCTHEGRLLLTLGERGKTGADKEHFNLPTDVAVLPDGSFYVSDGYRNTRVVKFDAAGHYQFEWGGKGIGPGQFNLPHGVAVDGRGRVLVCDRTNARLQVFDAVGKYITEWKGPQIGRPYGVSIAANGHIFVVDGGDQSASLRDHSKAVELDAEGTVVDSFGSWGKGPGQFQLGHDIAVAHDGSVYVAEGKGQRVQKFVRSVAGN